MSLSKEDIKLLQGWGMNVIRLGVMWPGVMPEKGSVNQTYLQEMTSIVSALADAGIYTLVEMHQDVFGERVCGEGVPSWLLDDAPPAPTESVTSVNQSANSSFIVANLPCFLAGGACRYPSEYVPTFPEPLAKRYSLSAEARGPPVPSTNQCKHMDWGAYYLSYAVARAFQDLYDNNWGWADRFGEYWATLAGAFKDLPGVIGYELMNEPWVGDQFADPLLLLPGVADSRNLQPFYDIIQKAIRDVDQKHLIFFESITFDDVRTGFTRVPGSADLANMSVLAYHYYRPPNLAVRQTLTERERERKLLNCGSFITEFGIPAISSSTYGSPRPLRPTASYIRQAYAATGLESILPEAWVSAINADLGVLDDYEPDSDVLPGDAAEVYVEADNYIQSWIAWEYKSFINKTGSNYGPFNTDGTINLRVSRQLARTYPQAVAGNITSFHFNPDSGAFHLSYVAANVRAGQVVPGDLSATTEVFLNRKYFYPTGSAIVVSQQCVRVEERDSHVVLHHSRECGGKQIELSIKAHPDSIL